MRQNPYMQGGYIGMGRQNLDQYEAANVKSAKRTSPRSTRGDSQVSRAPGSTAGLDRRLKSPQNSPPRERGSPSSGKSPPKSSSKATSPPKASSPPRAASSAFSAVAAAAALTPGSPASPPSPPPPAPAVSSELHELKELFAAPARPELAQPSEPPPPPPPQPQPEPQPNPLELLPIHPGFSEAWKEHRTPRAPCPAQQHSNDRPPLHPSLAPTPACDSRPPATPASHITFYSGVYVPECARAQPKPPTSCRLTPPPPPPSLLLPSCSTSPLRFQSRPRRAHRSHTPPAAHPRGRRRLSCSTCVPSCPNTAA